jgi:glycerol uptake facilitator-like aquaporin
MESLGKAAVAEFVATFALIFVGAGAVIVASSGQLDLVGVALAHGFVLAVMSPSRATSPAASSTRR